MDIFAVGALISLLGVGVIGMYAYRLVKSKVDAYYVMERRAGPWLIAGTFIATWCSMGGFIGMLGLGYKWGGIVTLWWYGSFWGIGSPTKPPTFSSATARTIRASLTVRSTLCWTSRDGTALAAGWAEMSFSSWSLPNRAR